MTELEAATLEKKYNQKVLDLFLRFHKPKRVKYLLYIKLLMMR
jgi:hypothetical protein